jgi:transposase
MKSEICIRIMEAAEYIAATGATVRACARRFCVSKSTIHTDAAK